MLRFIFCLLIFASFNANSQKVLKENLTKKKTFYWDFQNTKPQSIGSYYKDPLGETALEHGKWEYFDREGKLTEIRNYYKGKLHGPVILKYPNGLMRQEGYFINDLQDSVYRLWNESGVLETEGYFKDNKEFGIWKTFHIDGSPKMVEEIIDSTRFVQSFWIDDSLHTQTLINGTGKVVEMHNNGLLKHYYFYTSGVLNGIFLEKSILGDSSLSGSYKNGKKSGLWKFYYYTGKIEKICNYDEDRMEGKYQYFYDNGQVNTEGFYKSGQKNGLWTWYTKFGVRDMSGNFKEDQQHGDWTYWYPTGEIAYTAQYKMGLKDGNWNYFYKDGSKFKVGSFSNDEKEGLWETWYEDGTLLMSGKYVAGKEEGRWINNWENGKLKNETTFKAGVLHGEWKSYSFKGVLKLTGYYKNGLKNKEWVEYFENGRQKDLFTYKILKIKSKVKYGPSKGRITYESVKDGYAVSFSSKDFKKTEEGNYKDGEKDGEWKDYFPGGKIPAVTSTYKNGKLDGPMREYTRRGEVTSEVNYKDGMKHGFLRTYDSRGKVLTEREYEYGQLKVKGSFEPK